MNFLSAWVKGLTLFLLFIFLSAFSNLTYANPLAKITGPDVVLTGEPVSLSGLLSSGKSLKYNWKIIAAPKGSRVTAFDSSKANIIFEADRSGKYQVELRVFDGKTWSAPDKLTFLSVISTGETELKSEEYSASFICKMTLGFYGCDEIVRNFAIDDIKGSHSIVVENKGSRKAIINLNGNDLSNRLQLTGNDEISVSKVNLLKNNLLHIRFVRDGLLGGVGGSFKIKILKNRKLEKSLQVSTVKSNYNDDQIGKSITEVNLPPVPTAQNLKVLQNVQGVTRIFPNDPNSSQRHLYTIISNPGHGSALVTADGVLHYLPNNNFIGVDEVAVQVKDNGTPNLSANITVGIEVEQNYSPNPIAANITTIASAPGQTQIFPNDPNTVPQVFKYEIEEQPSNGSLAVYGSRFVYRASLGFVGSDSFIIKVSDNGSPALFALKTIGVSVIANSIPVIMGTDIVTFQSKVASSQLSFVDPDIGQGHTYGVSVQPSHGTATVNNQGLLLYTPNVGYSGSDSVVVSVKDSAIPMGVGLKTILISVSNNSLPVVNVSDVSTFQSTSVNTQVTYVDSDENQYHTFSVTTKPLHGKALLTQQGLLTYTPTFGYSGADSMVIAVSDNAIPSGVGLKTVNITVHQNTIPVIAASDITTIQNTNASTQVTFTDPDVGQNHTSRITQKTTHGTSTLGQDGLFSYTPDAGYIGSDTAVISVSDNALPPGVGFKTIQITVVPNTVPVVAASDITTFQSTSANTQVTFIDPDAGQNHTYSIASQPSHGTATLGQNGLFLYTPTIGFSGADSAVVAVSDNALPSGTGFKTIQITVIPNTIPTVAAANITTFQSTSASTQVTFVDPDLGQIHSYSIANQASHGTATIAPNGLFSYTPTIGYSGNDSVIVAVSDNALPAGVGTKTILITVVPNIIPVVAGDNINIFQGNDGTSHISFIDPDVGQNHLVQISSNAQHGFVFVDPLYNAVYHPTDRCQALADSFEVSVSDDANPNGIGTKTILVNVSPNTKPIVTVSDFSIEQNESASKQVQTFDPDSGESITYSIKQLPQFGMATISSTGLLTYSSSGASSAVEDTFEIAVKDSFGDCQNGEVVKTVHVNILPNRAPVLSDVADILIEQDTVGHTIAVATDPDQYQTLTYNISSDPLHGTVLITSGGAVSYTPVNNYTGTDQFIISVRDSGQPELVDEETVLVNVVPTNFPPVPTAPGLATLSGKSSTTTISSGDPDVSQTHVYQIISNPTLGTVSVNEFGVLTFNAYTGVEGVEEVQVRVTDNGVFPRSAIVYVAIEVVGNLAPNPSPVNIAAMVSGMNTQFTIAPNDPNEARFPGEYTFTIATAPTAGVAQVNSLGVVSYAAPVGFTGAVQFHVGVSDSGVPALTGLALVSINVVANAAPVVAAQTLLGVENIGIDKQIIFTDENASIQDFSFAVSQSPLHGVVTINSQGLLHYEPDLNYFGNDEFYVQVTDNGNPALSGVALYSVNLEEHNEIPNVLSKTLSVPKNGKLTYQIEFEDNDNTAQLHNFTVSQQPIHGVVTINQKGKLEYIPETDYVGVDSIKIKVTDSALFPGVGEGTLTINITEDQNLTPLIGTLDYSYNHDSYPRDVYINALSLSDPDGEVVKVVWDFGDGTPPLTVEKAMVSTDELRSTLHFYIQNGTYPVTMTAFDNQGGSTTHQMSLVLGNNITPIPSVITEVLGTNAPFTLNLDGSLSSDNLQIVTFCWTVKFAGNFIFNQCGTNPVASLPVNEIGLYTITLFVKDNGHGTASTEFELLIDGNDHSQDVVPYASLRTVNSRLATGPLLINFNSGNSRAFNGKTIDKILWVLSGIQVPGKNTAGTPTSFTYNVPGRHEAVLSIFDSAGKRTLASLPVFVSPAPSLTTAFSAENLNGQAFTFSGYEWSHGHIANFFWDFGDGTTAIGGYQVHNYIRPGKYRMELTTTDLSGNISSTTKVLVVGGSETINSGLSGSYRDLGYVDNAKTYNLTGMTSGYIISWSYGDGQTSNDGSSTTHTYTAPGIYRLKVLVVDPATGHSKEYIKMITILNAGIFNPNLNINLSTNQGNAPLPVSFGYTCDSSFVPTSTNWMIFDEQGPIARFTTSTFSYTFTEAKKYYVELIARNAAGTTDYSVQSVIVLGNKRIIEKSQTSKLNWGEKRHYDLPNFIKNN